MWGQNSLDYDLLYYGVYMLSFAKENCSVFTRTQ